MLLGIGCGGSSPPPAPPTPPPAPARPDAYRIDGTVTHLQRIALPPGTQARVALVDVSGGDAKATTLVERIFQIPHQVPVPFTLTVNPRLTSQQGRYELRASLADPKGAVNWVTAIPVPWKPVPVTSAVLLVVAPPRPPDPVETSPVRYRCDAAFSLGFEELSDDLVEVRLVDRTFRMARMPSALGITYSDGSNTFWIKEGIANLIVAGKVHNCYQRYP